MHLFLSHTHLHADVCTYTEKHAEVLRGGGGHPCVMLMLALLLFVCSVRNAPWDTIPNTTGPLHAAPVHRVPVTYRSSLIYLRVNLACETPDWTASVRSAHGGLMGSEESLASLVLMEGSAPVCLPNIIRA